MAMAPMFTARMSGGPEEQGRTAFSMLNLKKLNMKKIRKTGLIITLILLSVSCEELPDPAGLRGVAVVPAIEDVDPGIFDSKDLENSYVEFVVTVPEGESPQKISVLGSYQDNFERVVITEATSFPATIRIKSSDAAQKLGISLGSIANGDVFVFELQTLANNLATRSSAILRIPVACAYNVAVATGDYHAVSDWPSENDVTIEADPDDPYTILVTDLGAIDGIDEDNGPFVLHINPATYNIVAETKTLASDYYGYGAVTYSGYGSFSSCDGSYVLYIDISVGAYGSQGVYRFDVARKP